VISLAKWISEGSVDALVFRILVLLAYWLI
jgi:hypothetical protein